MQHQPVPAHPHRLPGAPQVKLFMHTAVFDLIDLVVESRFDI
jgi:hypothetical protein